MPSKPILPEDIACQAVAISDAIAAEDLRMATTLFKECAAKLADKRRSATEISHCVQWLRETQAAVRQCREHLALRLSATNVGQYGRSTSEATWSIDA